MGQQLPASVGALLVQQEARHRVRGRIGRMALRRQSEQDVADRVRVAGDADALQRAFAPAVEERPIFVRCSRAIVSSTAMHACAPAATVIAVKRVVVARHASGLAQEGDVASLQQREAAFDRARGRTGAGSAAASPALRRARHARPLSSALRGRRSARAAWRARAPSRLSGDVRLHVGALAKQGMHACRPESASELAASISSERPS